MILKELANIIFDNPTINEKTSIALRSKIQDMCRANGYSMSGVYKYFWNTTIDQDLQGHRAFYSIKSDSLYVQSKEFVGLPNLLALYKATRVVEYSGPMSAITDSADKLQVGESTNLTTVANKRTVGGDRWFDLEGAFGNDYDMYAPDARKVEVLEIFSPDIMEKFLPLKCSFYITREGSIIIQPYFQHSHIVSAQSHVDRAEEGVKRSREAYNVLHEAITALLEVDNVASRMVTNEQASSVLI